MATSYITPEFLTRFKCIGAECEDTCCKGWNMQLGNPTYERYTKEAPELLDSVSGGDGDYIMKRDPKTDYCVKFSDGLCGIQQKYGENFLGDACYFYPRATRAIGNTTKMTATLSCPEIARLALFDDEAFSLKTADIEHLPTNLVDYLPSGLTSEQALAIHQIFLQAAIDKAVTPERTIMRIYGASESLERINTESWPDAVPFYLQNADAGLPIPMPRETDPAFLLQALCGLVVAAKKVNNERLMHTIHEMEQALHVTIRMDTLTIVPLPDSINATQQLQKRWTHEWREIYTPLLRRYLAMQLSLALFPFGGFGNNLVERVSIIGIRFATVKLALMSACSVAKAPLEKNEIVRVMQSISRFLDHLADPEFSLQIYNETGWLQKPRLRALLGDF